tara:strand:+ start:116 stop:235 length:120 start_codon:yes stop_codon:yes gene_type:complete
MVNPHLVQLAIQLQIQDLQVQIQFSQVLHQLVVAVVEVD